MCRKCEICCGEVEHGICLNCGLPADDYYPEEEDDEEDEDEEVNWQEPQDDQEDRRNGLSVFK